jgi:hypothetical protein
MVRDGSGASLNEMDQMVQMARPHGCAWSDEIRGDGPTCDGEVQPNSVEENRPNNLENDRVS